jgi:hypothetical protein
MSADAEVSHHRPACFQALRKKRHVSKPSASIGKNTRRIARFSFPSGARIRFLKFVRDQRSLLEVTSICAPQSNFAGTIPAFSPNTVSAP